MAHPPPDLEQETAPPGEHDEGNVPGMRPGARPTEVLVGLFLYPHILLFALRRQGRWGRALLLLCLTTAVAGTIQTLVILPRLQTRTVAWAEWLGREVGTLWIDNERLRWERPTVLPHTTRRDGWRLDFVEDAATFDPERLEGPEMRGVWLSAGAVHVWWRPSGGEPVYVTLFDAERSGRVFLHALWPGERRLQGSRFGKRARTLVWQAIPGLCLWHVLSLLLPVLTYSLFFSVVAMMFRGPSGVGGFRAVCSFHLYAGIPPMLVGAVYAGLDVPFLDFGRVFVIAFIAYLFLVFSGRARMTAPDDDASR